MVNRKDGSVDSRFFITTRADSGYLDDKYCAFGRVIGGLSLLRRIDGLDVIQPKNRPKAEVRIVDCGLLEA